MEVIHANEQITHAILGKGEVIEFKASTSSQIIFLLSTGLYKYPRLACVREILCNAWDAHIITGQRHVPVRITIDGETHVMTIRDFGTGIAHEHMGAIYCTAGDSTKVASEEETGGFGLGSKAPYAYVDHFTVISYHEGVRTMYAMSLSDSESMGNPTAKVLHSGPTTETGMEVRIQLKPEDILQFEELCQRVAYYGDINTTFNGEVLEVCGMDASDSNVSVLVREHGNDLYRNLKFGIRYGAVVYPLEENHEYSHELYELSKLIQDKFGGMRDCMLVMRAPANTVSMVPSREALLYNPRTIGTMKKLLTEAHSQLSSAADVDPRKYVAEIVQRAVQCGWDFSDMLNSSVGIDWPQVVLPYSERARQNHIDGMMHQTPTHGMHNRLSFSAKQLLRDTKNAHSPQEFAIRYVVHNYYDVMRFPGVMNWYKERVFKIATTFGGYNPAMLNKLFRKGAKRQTGLWSTLIRDYFTRPYLRAVDGLIEDPKSCIFAFRVAGTGEGSTTWTGPKDAYIADTEKYSIFNRTPKKRREMIDFANPVIVVMSNQGKYGRQVFDSMFNEDCKWNTIPVLKINPKKVDVLELKKRLNKQGFRVYSTVERQLQIIEEAKEAAAARRAQYMKDGVSIEPKKSKVVTKESIAALTNCLKNNEVNSDRWRTMADAPALITSPETILVLRASKNENSSYIGFCKDELSLFVVKKYGATCGITNREATAKRFYEDGAVPLAQKVAADVLEWSQSPRAVALISEQTQLDNKDRNLCNDWSAGRILAQVIKLNSIKKELGFIVPTDEERYMLKMLQRMHDYPYMFEIIKPKDIRPEVGKFKPEDWHPAFARLKNASCKKMGNSLSNELSSNCYGQGRHFTPEAEQAFAKFILVALEI